MFALQRIKLALDLYTDAWFYFILLSVVKSPNVCLYLIDVIWNGRSTCQPDQTTDVCGGQCSVFLGVAMEPRMFGNNLSNSF